MEKLTDVQFLDLLNQKNIHVSVKEERLQISAPTGALDDELRAELVRRKPGLIAFLVKARVSSEPIEARTKDVTVPQTPLQKGLWLIDHYQPGNVAYNIPEAFLAEMPIEVDLLQRAADQLLARHEILRTSFHEQDGELIQLVSDEAKTIIECTDLSAVPPEERGPELKKLVREHARKPFDLKQAPLIRFHIFTMSDEQSIFFLNIHHIIADRKAVDVLREELMALYMAAVENQPASLPSISVQYADYALWAEKQMTSETVEKQLKYWKRKLAGVPPFLQLPHSHPYPAVRTSWGATASVEVPASLFRNLKKIAQEENASSFMTFMAVFALLLHVYSGAEDFCIGSPSTLRRQAVTERMIGVFVNTLPFRCQMTEESTFRELVRQVRKTALEAYDNSDIPFQKLVSLLKPDRKSQRSPIFQVLLGFETNSADQGGAQQLDTEPGTARYDLTLNLFENPAGAHGSLEYCTDLFAETDIQKLIEGLSIVESAAGEPDAQFSTIFTA